MMTTRTNLNVLWRLLVKCDSEDLNSSPRSHFSFWGLTFALNWKRTNQNNKTHTQGEVCPGIARAKS